MVRIVPLVAALFVAGLVARTLAQEPPAKIPDAKPVEVVKKSDESITKADKNKHREACEKILKVELANSLIALGHDTEASDSNKVAALLLAAEMLHHLHCTEGVLKDKDGKALKNDVAMPADLLKEAKAMAKDAQLQALCALTEKELAKPTRGRAPYPISGNTTLGGQAIYESKFVVGAPAIVYASAPGGEVLSIRIMNASVIPPQVVEERTGSTVRLEWCPRQVGPDATNTYKIFITPVGPPGFKVQWGTN